MALPSALPHDWTNAPCLDLINSRWSDHLGSGQHYDRLPLPVFRRAFLKRWGYRVGDPDDAAGLARLRSLRAFLRGVLEQYIAGRPLTQSARRRLESEINWAPISMRLVSSPEGFVLSAGRSGATWDVVISEIATSAARLMSERASVKVCANPACSWMFTDETRPRTRRWCNVSVCGSLINVRRHRAGRHD
ncbi:MAG TPA: CGNR zinc finger domain-containing protein [Candidatus Dormibacteraeota bacterium]